MKQFNILKTFFPFEFRNILTIQLYLCETKNILVLQGYDFVFVFFFAYKYLCVEEAIK